MNSTPAALPDVPYPTNRWFWVLAAAVLLVSAGLQFYGLGKWPWDVDEVSSLEELGLLDPSIHQAATDPASTTVRLPRLVPVWYTAQGLLLRLVPHDELGSRLLGAVCGVLTVLLLFVFGWRRRGPPFAVALAILAGGSSLLVWLAQQNRFYTVAMLLLVLAMMAIWSRATGWKMLLATAACTLLAVLSHNLLAVLFGLGMVAACVAYPAGWIPKPVFVRSVVSGVLASAVYLFYVRPIAGGWTGAGFAWTNPLVSLVAHVGVPTLALSLLGCAASLGLPDQRREMAWWAGLAIASLLFVAAAPWVVPIWNARYALLFALPLWMTGAMAVELIARRLGSARLVVFWYGCVVLLLAPKLASYYLDGSRHDFRQAAQLAAAEVGRGEPILTNMELRVRYYFAPALRPRVQFWEPSDKLPAGECLIVYGSNIWDPVLRVPGRPTEVLAQIGRRRYDELSQVVRVYRVGPAR